MIFIKLSKHNLNLDFTKYDIRYRFSNLIHKYD